MSIKAYGYKLRKEDYGLINRMGSVVGEKISIYDLASYEKDIEDEDIVLVFGEHTKRMCRGSTCKALIEFPELVQLDQTLGDEPTRQEAYGKLLKLKEALQDKELDTTDVKQNLTEGSLPKLTSGEVKTLEEMLLKKGITHWIGVTTDGRSVRLSVEPERSVADVDITFAELFALRSAMEVLRIQEFEVVHTSTNDSKQSSGS
jgi:hypothetical protein